MTTAEQVRILALLGHLPSSAEVPSAVDLALGVKRFQRHLGLAIDGIVGPKTSAKLAALAEVRLPSPDQRIRRLAPWRMTSYYVIEQTESGPVPIVDQKGNYIASVSANFFANASLEGTARLVGGTLINVDGNFVPALNPNEYSAVLAWYRGYERNLGGRKPKPPGYFGIQLTSDGQKVARVKPFLVVPRDKVGLGYGVEKLGIPKEPYRTLAADLGTMAMSDRTWAGKGGIAGPGTRVFILEAVGRLIPGQPQPHDGWFTVNDCGGGIFGAHFDQFVGTPAMAKRSPIVERAHAWFAGIEEKIPVGYDLGLYDG